MEIAFTIFAGILLGIGFLGTFVPVLPGAPLAWAGLLLAYFSVHNQITIPTLVVTGIVAIVVSVLDNVFPITMTKKTGGSKAATTGSTIGLIIGLFVGPLGIILGPFCGALVGELIHNNGEFAPALRVAWGAFLGFLVGTGLKMAAVVWFIWVYIFSF